MPIDTLVDEALDRAMEKTMPDEVEIPASKEPVEAPQTEPEPIAASNRDDSGKFKSTKQISDQEASVETTEAVKPVAEGESPAAEAEQPIELPTFWSAELKALTAEAPPELKKKFIEHDTQRENYVRRQLTEIAPIKAEKARMDEVVAPHREELARLGVRDHAELVSRAIGWNDLMTKDIKGYLNAQLRQNGLTPYDLFEAEGNPGQPQQVSDPRVDEALTAAQEAKEQFEEYKQAEVNKVLTSELETFKQGKDSIGQTRKAFVEMYEPQIGQVIEQMRAEYPQLSRQDLLHHSYEFVVGEARKAFGVSETIKSQPTAQQIAATTSKQKNAASSVRGAPASGTVAPKPRLKGDNFNQKLDSALDIAMSRTAGR